MNKLIVHLSDLHIGSKFNGKSRSSEYSEVFSLLIEKCSTIAQESSVVVVITGDIFNNKSQYSGDDIGLFNQLIIGLTSAMNGCEIIIIPGIHDMLIENDNVCDLVSPLIKWDNVHYIRENGFKTVCGIDFYHISILDQRQITNTIIETERLCSRTNDRISGLDNPSVLLYHGVVRKAKLANGMAVTSKLPPEIYKHYNAVLLGELHDYQKIEHNIAYAGALLQQSPHESVEKGFLLWHLKPSQTASHFGPSWSASHAFIRIKSDYVQKQINLTGLSVKECEEALLNIDSGTRLIVVSKNSVSEEVLALIPKDAKKVIYAGMDGGVQWTAFTDAIKNVGDCKIRDKLTEMFNRDCAFSGKRASWGLIDMKWANLFRYGPVENRIDFTSMRGLTGIMASNNAGKTSILDIILLVLFNYSIRGNKHNVIRRGAKSGYAIITFYVKTPDGSHITYRVNRTEHVSSVGSTTGVILEMYDQTAKNWVNISCKIMTSTYVKMREMLGTHEVALATCMYYKNGTNDITTTNGQNATKIIIDCLGLSVINTTLDMSRVRVGELRKRIIELEDKYKPPRQTLDECIKIRQDCEKEYKRIKRRLARQDNKKREQTLIGLCQLRDDYRRELSAIKRESTSAKLLAENAQNCQRLQEYQAELLRWENANNWDKWNSVLGKYNGSSETVAKLRVSCEKLRANISAKAEALYSRLCAIDGGIGKIFKSREIGEVSAALSERRLENVAQINNAPRAMPRMFGAITAIEMQIKTQRESNKYKFNHGCRECNHNEEIINSDIRALEAKLAELRENDKLGVESNTKRNAIISAANETINEIDLCTRDVAEYQVSMNQYIKHESDKVTEENAYNNWVIACEKRDEHERMLAEIKSLQNAISAAKTGTETAEEAELSRKLATVLVDIEKLERDLLPVDSESGCEVSEHEKNEAYCKLLNAEAALKLRAEYDTAASDLHTEIDVYKIYIKLFSSDEIKANMLSSAIRNIENIANDLLQLVCGFRVSLKLEGNDLIIYLVESIGVGPVAYGGGYQQFMVAIALRFALSNVSHKSADFIFIDEGFGCADHVNAGIVNSFLQTVSKLYNNIFIITHTSGMSDIMDHKLFINVGATWSSVQRCEANEEAYSDITDDNVNNIGDMIVNHAITQQLKNGLDMDMGGEINVGALPATQMKCECGAVISRKSFPSHVRSIRHTKALGITLNNTKLRRI